MIRILFQSHLIRQWVAQNAIREHSNLKGTRGNIRGLGNSESTWTRALRTLRDTGTLSHEALHLGDSH